MNSILKYISKRGAANYFKKLKDPDRVFRKGRFDGEHIKEKAEYVETYNNRIKEIKKEFWTEHTKVENDAIENFNKVEGERLWHDNCKDRNWLIQQSWNCQNKMKDLMDAQKKFLARRKIWKIEDDEKFEENQALLTLLDRQSKNWLTPANFSHQISNVLDIILPPSIVSHKDYYNKLNTYALLIDEGKLEEAERFKRQDLNDNYKNSLLEPVFTNLKKMIKNMTHTSEHDYYMKYDNLRKKIENNYDTTRGLGKDLLDALKSKFKEIIIKKRELSEAPAQKLEQIESSLSTIISLIIGWNRYCEIVYMSDENLGKLSKQINNEPDEEELTGITSINEDDDSERRLLDQNYNFMERQKNLFMTKLTDSESKLYLIKLRNFDFP